MGNKFENYTAEEFMKLCFADDSGKYKNRDGYRFWENFNKLNTDNIKLNDFPIYYSSENPDERSLPDPDSCSKELYKAHLKVWQKNFGKFKKSMKKLKNIKYHGRHWYELITDDDKIILSSDSIMSIYWHRKYGNTPEIMEKVQKTSELNKEIEKLEKKLKKIGVKEKESNSDYSKEFSLYKRFIWLYLQYANTIGGFILFPKHINSINQIRGKRPIDDRFDLTLECIRRFYTKSPLYNPLQEILGQDEKFFDMFGTFQNYIKFFCLDESYGDKHSWVNENGQVLNLMNNEPLDDYNFSKEPLPNAEQWWTFYDNIMNRLDARNEQIKRLIQQKGD